MAIENETNKPLQITIHPSGWQPPQGPINPNYNPETGKNIYAISTSPLLASFEALLEEAGTSGKVINGFLKAPGQIFDFAINFSKVNGDDNFKATVVATGQVVYGVAIETVLADALGLVFESYVYAYTGLVLYETPVTIVATIGAVTLMALGYDPINEAVGDSIGRMYDSIKNNIQNLFGSQNEKPATLESAQVIEHEITGDINSTIHKGDAKDTIEKLGGSVWVNDVTPVHSDLEGQDYSLVKSDARTSINGKNYFINDVMDSLDNVATATTNFINTQAGNYLHNTFDTYNINQAISSFFSKHGQELANGSLSAANAAKYFIIELAEGGLSDSIIRSLLPQSMLDLRDAMHNGASSAQIATLANAAQPNDSLSKVLDKMGFTDPATLSVQLQDSLAKMAVEFALHSSGWDAGQYRAANDNCNYEIKIAA